MGKLFVKNVTILAWFSFKGAPHNTEYIRGFKHLARSRNDLGYSIMIFYSLRIIKRRLKLQMRGRKYEKTVQSTWTQI